MIAAQAMNYFGASKGCWFIAVEINLLKHSPA
jgi:hypothetical protein